MFNQHYFSSQITKTKGTSLGIRSSLLLGAIALGLTTTLLLPLKSTAQQTEPNDTNVTIEELADDTEQYVGQTITIRSQVAEELDDSSLILQTDESFGGAPVLVFNADSNSLNRPSEDIPIQVTGTVQQLVLADIENQYGVDLDERLYTDYENQPAIIAESVALAPTIEDLAENPSDYYDLAIAVEGLSPPTVKKKEI
jgi:hypothetical protein